MARQQTKAQQTRGSYKCSAKSDSSTFTLQIKVSAACQLDYQMGPAALQETTCYISSDVAALQWICGFFLKMASNQVCKYLLLPREERAILLRLLTRHKNTDQSQVTSKTVFLLSSGSSIYSGCRFRFDTNKCH